jgi:hypothetical protein
MKTSNGKCRAFVQNCQAFKANNLFAVHNREGVYSVWSYGYHFPLFAYLNGTWYENSDRYSVSTSKHRSQSHPLTETVKVNTEDLQRLIRG